MDNEIKRTLWATADKLRSNMDAAEYKHIVLGLIFLKYISDSFAEHRATLEKRFADPHRRILHRGRSDKSKRP
jgi:type I restriction enzyme M protein